jgi:hypothetical protein
MNPAQFIDGAGLFNLIIHILGVHHLHTLFSCRSLGDDVDGETKEKLRQLLKDDNLTQEEKQQKMQELLQAGRLAKDNQHKNLVEAETLTAAVRVTESLAEDIETSTEFTTWEQVQR